MYMQGQSGCSNVYQGSQIGAAQARSIQGRCSGTRVQKRQNPADTALRGNQPGFRYAPVEQYWKTFQQDGSVAMCEKIFQCMYG